MKVGQFTIENTDEKTWGNYFVRRMLKVSSIKVIFYNEICVATYCHSKLM